MAEFTSRDKTIATLLNFGLLLAFALYIIFVDGFRSVDRIYTEMGRMVGSGGMLSFEVQWFACLVVSVAIFLWGNRVRAGLLRISPPWLALSSQWLFCIFCGVLGFGLYMFNMLTISDMEDSVLPFIQGGLLSIGFALLCIMGMVRPLPGK
jgi:hypothetical protein